MTMFGPGMLRQIASLLRRLGCNDAGNVIIIVAASLFPLLVLIGSGIDMGRGYLAQTRLQQACDSGTLAARKRLGTEAAVGGVIPANVADTGQRFFNINFRDGAYGSENRDFEMVLEEDYAVSGLATADVPTTVMGAFGHDTISISAECSSQLNMPNTDVMMVLDTTGSMLRTNPGDTQSRIVALRATVQSFHAQLEASKAAGTRIRYGFVPYSTNVNVGALLQDDWLVDEWSYNFREANGVTITPSIADNYRYYSASRPNGTQTVRNAQWRYDNFNVDLGFLDTTNFVTYPIGGSPSAPYNVNAYYRGCIEERDTYEINDYTNVDLNRALDLDIDRVPDPTDPDTQWRPMLNELSFIREVRNNGSGPFTPGVVTSPYDFVNAWWWGYGACPAPAQKLQEMTAAQVTTYVNSLTAQGSTYHDIGMIWGGRLLSSTGLFATENADVDGSATSRHLIFMTDGETAPLDISYGSYGIEPLDRRRWRPSSSMTLTETVENRFSFACEEVKRRNIQVWVISFGSGNSPMLEACAGAEHYYVADDAVELQNTFSDIARRMGELRIVD